MASELFPRIQADRLLLEYDDSRSGGFEPLRLVPDEKTVVLGLVSTKRPRLEAQDAVAARIREASAYHPLECLALSPQCGFASSVVGNQLSEEDQRRKLELVVATAEQTWPHES